MDDAFFKWLSSQYCESCLLLNILASERLLERLKAKPTYEIPQTGRGDRPLEILDLSDCCLTDDDAQVLSALLLQEEGVKAIDLSLNQIGDGGAVALSELLVPNGFVSQLNLSQNNIAEIGGLAFCNALSRQADSSESSQKGQQASAIVTLRQNPLPLDVSDLLNSYGQKQKKEEEEEQSNSENFSVASLLRSQDQVNDFSSEDEDVAVVQVDNSISIASDEVEDDQVLQKFVRKDVTKPCLEVDCEVLELPEYSVDLEQIARRDFLEEGIEALLSDSDELNLSNLCFTLADLEAKLQSMRTAYVTVLDLSSNDLESIPNYLPESLRKLLLQNNKIKTIDNLFNCPHLQVLDLSQNSLGSNGQGFLPGLCSLSLNELSLSGNSLSDLDVLNSIGHLQKLEKLDVSNNLLEPLEVINHLGQTHSQLLLHLILVGNAGDYNYEDLARKKLLALTRIDEIALSERNTPKEKPALSKLFHWRSRRKQKNASAEVDRSEDDHVSPSKRIEDETSQEYDFGDFLLLSARLGILELPHQRTSFSYFSKTSEFLCELFQELDHSSSGFISAKSYAIGFDKVQKRYAKHVSRDGRNASAIIDSRCKIQEYLGNHSLQAIFGSFSKLEVEGQPVTNGSMTFLDLLRWIDTCFVGGISKKTRTQQKLIVSFFTRERRVPKFNFLDFIFSILFVCNITKLSPDKVIRHVLKHMRNVKPIELASADEIMSLEALKQSHITEMASGRGGVEGGGLADARKVYHEIYLKGFPAEEFIKHKNTKLLLSVLDIALEEQEKFVAADQSRILQLRKELKHVTRKIKSSLTYVV